MNKTHSITHEISLYIMAIFIVCVPLACVFGEQNIGWVDLDKVSRLAQPVQQIIDDVEDAVKPRKDEIEKKMEQLDVLKITFEQQRSILSEEQRKTREKEIAQLEQEIESMTTEINQMFGRMEQEQLTPAYDLVMKTIQEVARKKGIAIVFAREMVVWADSSIDLTNEVIDELNKGSQSFEKPSSQEAKQSEPPSVEHKTTTPMQPPATEPTPLPTPVKTLKPTPTPRPLVINESSIQEFSRENAPSARYPEVRPGDRITSGTW